MTKCKMICGGVVGWVAFACVAMAADSLSEGFDDVTTLAGDGWVITNNSSPVGESDWFQGNDGIFSSQAGASDSYIAANFLNADFEGNISDWLILPVLMLDSTSVLSFYTRTEVASEFPDRLEVRLSTNGTSTDVGTTDASVGDFSTRLLSINPDLEVGGYPEEWTQFNVPLDFLGASTLGRLAFRYFVPDTSINGDYIGVDTVVVSTVPEPGSAALCSLAAALAGGAWLRRRMRRTTR